MTCGQYPSWFPNDENFTMVTFVELFSEESQYQKLGSGEEKFANPTGRSVHAWAGFDIG